MSVPLPSQRLEECREFWANVARKNGWYKEPFFVQVWVDSNGNVTDSVSHQGLDRDYVLDEDDTPIFDECPSCGREILGSSQNDIGLCTGCNGN